MHPGYSAATRIDGQHVLRTVLEILEMDDVEMTSLLSRVDYGHLGCTRDATPYVIPIHYVYQEPNIFIYTTAGMKTQILSANPQICLQVEEVQDSSHWRSVIVHGYAHELTTAEEKRQALGPILEENPDLKPALARTWIGSFLRSQSEVIYKIGVHHMSGRKTLA